MYVSDTQIKFARVGLYEAVLLGEKTLQAEWSELTPHKITTKQKYEEVQSYGEFGFAQAMNEGTGVSYDNYVQGYNKTYTPIIRALAFKASKQALAMDRYNVVTRHGPALANAITATRNLLAANVYSTGFSGSGVLGPDQKTLFATDHPTFTGTASNRGRLSDSLDQTLAAESLKDGIVKAMKQVNHRGIPQPINGKLDLIVPTDQVADATVLVDTMLLPGSQYNDINYSRGRINRIIDSPYIAFGDSTKSNSWYLRAADKTQHSVFMLTRQDVTTDADKDFDNIAMKFLTYCEDVCGYFDWRGLVGNDA